MSKVDKQIRKLLKDYPNPHMYVVGEGTVRMDAEKIRESESYKEFLEKMKTFKQSWRG